MRFMMRMIPRGYEKATSGTMPDPKSLEAMMKYNQSLKSAGLLISLEGLHLPSTGARVSFEKGKPNITQGPFPEVKEAIGGFWMINVKLKEEAIKWASRCPASENEIIEIGQIQEFEEFSDDIKKGSGEFRNMQDKNK